MRRPASSDDPFGFNIAPSAARDVVGATLAERAQARAKVPAEPARRKLLYVDLVPASAWYSNLRAELDPSEWKALQKLTFKRAGYCCEICSGKGPKWPVECHERWAFDESTGIQRLTGLEALCPDCHETTHMGLASVRGRADQAELHLKRVNGWSDEQARDHVLKAFKLHKRLSARPWTLDASLLLSLPVKLTERTRQTIERHAELAGKIKSGPLGRDALLGMVAEMSPPER